MISSATSKYEELFVLLLQLATKHNINVIANRKSIFEHFKSSMFIIINDWDENIHGNIISVDPGLTIQEKVKSLAINLGFHKLMKNRHCQFENFIKLNENTDVWLEEYENIRDKQVDRFGEKLESLLTRKLEQRNKVYEILYSVS